MSAGGCQSTRPLVDVVIPAHNAETTIERAVRSVLAQRLDEFELIVVDDRCTDRTVALVESFDDPRIRVVRADRPGVSAARNAGAAAGGAPKIAFLDADDEAFPQWLELMLNDRTRPFITCGHVVRETSGTTGPTVGGTSMLAGCFVVDRQLFERVEGYDERFAFSENTDLELRLSTELQAMGESPLRVDAPLVLIHRSPSARRTKYSPRTLWDSSEMLLESHGDRLSPGAIASFSGVAGLNALRLGDRRRARHHFRTATRSAPRRLKYWVRLGQTFLPGTLSRDSSRRRVDRPGE